MRRMAKRSIRKAWSCLRTERWRLWRTATFTFSVVSEVVAVRLGISSFFCNHFRCSKSSDPPPHNCFPIRNSTATSDAEVNSEYTHAFITNLLFFINVSYTNPRWTTHRWSIVPTKRHYLMDWMSSSRPLYSHFALRKARLLLSLFHWSTCIVIKLNNYLFVTYTNITTLEKGVLPGAPRDPCFLLFYFNTPPFHRPL